MVIQSTVKNINCIQLLAENLIHYKAYTMFEEKHFI